MDITYHINSHTQGQPPDKMLKNLVLQGFKPTTMTTTIQNFIIKTPLVGSISCPSCFWLHRIFVWVSLWVVGRISLGYEQERVLCPLGGTIRSLLTWLGLSVEHLASIDLQCVGNGQLVNNANHDIKHTRLQLMNKHGGQYLIPENGFNIQDILCYWTQIDRNDSHVKTWQNFHTENCNYLLKGIWFLPSFMTPPTVHNIERTPP